MSIRKSAVVIAFAALASPIAFANSGATWVGGEVGFETHPLQSNRTRAQVQAELKEFRANPITVDGGRVVGGDAGYVPHQHEYVRRDGRRVHNDAFNATAPSTMGASPALSESERRAMREQYIN
ncbi:DUF4148 domain-containing protein [Ramlibacter sp. AN1015]|uniref:DUF4148 domain-containing protein n=1 Tax=Ramlibacter sp. AN1015 TaxID=3133428 RepID=UPI0030C16E71